MTSEYDLGFKIEMKDGELVQRPLTEKEKEIDGKYAQSVLESFIPRRMPLQAPTEPAGEFK